VLYIETVKERARKAGIKPVKRKPTDEEPSTPPPKKRKRGGG
jgi:hypothetical protein